MVRYIIGEEVDKDFSLELTSPEYIAGTSELCRKNDLYKITLKAPYKNNVKSETFVVHLYASNSNSNPYLFQRDNYWVNLIPTWKFYSADGKTIITDLPITVEYKSDESGEYLFGEAQFHYVDDMPSSLKSPIYIWATLDTEKIIRTQYNDFTDDPFELNEDSDNIVFPGTTKIDEKLSWNNEEYTPPSYANSKIIAVATTLINPVPPTKLSITRDSKQSISTGTYWSNQIIPFIATVNSDRYQLFLEEDELVGQPVSDIVYNYPNVTGITSKLSGDLHLEYEDFKTTDFSSLVEKYIYFTDNQWEFVSKYLPPRDVLETSGYIPPKNILEIMDYPTYDDLQRQYPDIQLDQYFDRICNECEDEKKPDENILYLNEYVRLISEHRIFKYIPYALRVIDTLSVGPNGNTNFVFSSISALSATDKFENPEFNLMDLTNGYNYKTGGYAFCKTTCPELYGKNYIGKISASAYIDTAASPYVDHHIFKYWVISDGKFIYAADDKDTTTEIDSDIEAYIKKQVYHQPSINKKIDDILVKTTTDDHISMKGGFVGVSCTVQDPLYNSWVCDADTGYLYKFNPNNDIKHKINLYEKINEFITDNVTDEHLLSYWNGIKESGVGVSPTHMVLNSKNELFITFFDTMILVKASGLNGAILNVYLFPDNVATDSAGLPLDGSWRPVGVDTNEYDEVVILFNTAYNDGDPDPVYSIPSDAKLVFFDGNDFYDTVITLSDCGDEIFSSFTDKHMDTNQVLFRSTPTMDYVYVCGTIEHAKETEYAFVLRYQKPRQHILTDCLCCDPNETKMEVIFKYERLCSLPIRPSYPLEDPNAFDFKPPESSPKDFHLDIDNMFLDGSDTLWFTLNRDYSQTHKNPPIVSDLIAIKDAAQRIPHTAAYIPLYGIRWITGISQSSTSDMLFIDAENNRIAKFTPLPNGTLKYHPKIDIKIENTPAGYENGRLFSRGDWTGINWFNKYMRVTRKTISTDGDTPVPLFSYENYYVRKHSEEWDVAEHAKIPVIHTDFPENNPTLFKAIGETLGIDEHKHYSIGKKLFEGIANQIGNIHDIDECHINSIYSLAKKEDVNIDKFVLNYPEELRRMTDLLSINRKKLWGDRCHCDQNYFRAKHKDQRKYCKKCRHVHETNVGKFINTLSTEPWVLTKYLIDYETEIDENSLKEICTMMLKQISVLNVVLSLDQKIPIPEINDIKDCVAPVNSMLIAIEGYSHQRHAAISNDVDVGSLYDAVKFIDSVIRELPNCYLIEDKFERDNFFRVNISKKSFEETEHIYYLIKTKTYLSDDDIILMTNGGTNEKIILYASVLNIEEEALDICCNPVPAPPDPDKYKDPKNMFEAKSILESQIESFNKFNLVDDHGYPIQIDANVPTTSFEFDQKLGEIINILQLNGYHDVDDLPTERHNWTDIKLVLKTFNTIIYKKYVEEYETDKTVCDPHPRVEPTPELLEKIRCAQLLAIHTSFFASDHWYNYCYWKFLPYKCRNLNTSVINWESKYTTLDEFDDSIKSNWYENTGMMIKLMNYILHNGTLFHHKEEYIDD